ncbi:MAG: DUF1684 domain-containing protein [Candidatus Eisenbacteria bacterium]|nr:DUF1684 domain-containing protein [Candidatus Eisenbacteria bacterium]
MPNPIVLLITLAATVATHSVAAPRAHAAAHAAPVPAIHPATAAHLAAPFADSLRSAYLKDRADTEEWLKSKPTSYLAAIARLDFGDKRTLIVGREAACDVRIDDPELAARHLSVTVQGDSFRVQALDDTAHFAAGDAVRREATLGPSAIRIGRFTLRLSHQRFPAIIVFDPRSPGFARYHGLHWFPADFAYRFELPLTPNPRPDTVIILSTRGNQRRALRVGWFDFEVSGTPCRLEATRLLEPGVGDNDFGVFFRDATSGHESYALGRYVDIEKASEGRYVLDFNACYNPACAVSDHYNCPIPPRENRLKVAIRAGEMDSHYH